MSNFADIMTSATQQNSPYVKCLEIKPFWSQRDEIIDCLTTLRSKLSFPIQQMFFFFQRFDGGFDFEAYLELED